MLKEELRPGLVVIARGTAATVVHCLPDLKVQVVTNLQRETLIVRVDELEILPVRSEENIGAISSSLVARADTADAEEIEAAKNRFKVISLYLAKSISRKQAVRELGVSNGMFYKLLRLCEEESGYFKSSSHEERAAGWCEITKREDRGGYIQGNQRKVQRESGNLHRGLAGSRKTLPEGGDTRSLAKNGDRSNQIS